MAALYSAASTLPLYIVCPEKRNDTVMTEVLLFLCAGCSAVYAARQGVGLQGGAAGPRVGRRRCRVQSRRLAACDGQLGQHMPTVGHALVQRAQAEQGTQGLRPAEAGLRAERLQEEGLLAARVVQEAGLVQVGQRVKGEQAKGPGRSQGLGCARKAKQQL